MKLQDVVDKLITVTGYKITKSKFKEDNYVAIQYDMDGEQHVTFTGAQVLIEQLKKYGEEVPFETTIKRMGKFYSFT
jgi:hypothetical protein